MDIDLRCTECNGKGPVSRWRLDERGDMVPVPFQPCGTCGLDWPVEQQETCASTLSISVSMLVMPLTNYLRPAIFEREILVMA